MRKKSTYVVLLVMLFTFFIVMFLTLGLNNIKQGQYDTTLLVGNDTVWKYSKKKWSNVSKLSSIKELIYTPDVPQWVPPDVSEHPDGLH